MYGQCCATETFSTCVYCTFTFSVFSAQCLAGCCPLLQAARLVEANAVVSLSSASEATRLAEVANKMARCNLVLQLAPSITTAPGPIAAAGASNGVALPAPAAAPVMAHAQQVGNKRKAVGAPAGGRV